MLGVKCGWSELAKLLPSLCNSVWTHGAPVSWFPEAQRGSVWSVLLAGNG